MEINFLGPCCAFSSGGVRVGSMGSIEPTDFWRLYVVNLWIFWQNISGIEYDYHYLDSSLVLNPWIEIPNATPGGDAKLKYLVQSLE